MSTEEKQNYVIGRGRVTVDGRCIGNASHVEVVGPTEIRVVCDNISPENIAMFLAGEKDQVSFRYDSNNACGADFWFSATAAMSFGPLSLVTTEWMTLRIKFQGTVVYGRG